MSAPRPAARRGRSPSPGEDVAERQEGSPVNWRVVAAGDGALTIELGSGIDAATRARVAALDAAIARLQAEGAIAGLIEAVPALRALTLLYDPLLTSSQALLASIASLRVETEQGPPVAGQHWRLPVCYGGEHGPDLGAVAESCGLDPAEVVRRHAARSYEVCMLGFLPGFAFMAEIDAALQLPRRPEPRVRVPPGSVAIATGLTAIYPWESPGGWHLLGRCPVPLFDAGEDRPALLAPGDRVSFVAIGAEEFAQLEVARTARALPRSRWMLTAEAPP